MALRKPLVLNGGRMEQLQPGDNLDAIASEVDAVSKSNGGASPLVICTPVYVKADGTVDAAQANASGTVELLGLVRDASIAPAASGSIQTDGILSATTGEWDAVAGTTGGLVPGTVYYLDPAAAGMLTDTAPTTVGQFVVRVGLAISTTELDISLMQPIKL